MKKQLLIFDCFGVIFNEVAPIFLRKYLSEEAADKIKDSIFVPADLGQITYEELMNTLASAVGADRTEVIREWNKLFILREETVELIRELRQNYCIALLSNAPSGLVEEMFERLGLTDLFDHMVISSAVGLAKPDLRIYLHCISLFRNTFDRIYMIDDNPSNLEPLSEAGIIPILFTGPDSVREAIS